MAKPTATPKEKNQKELLETLDNSFKTIDGRNKLDRYRDFRAVFLGTDEGKRVLHDILGFAKLSAPIVPPFPEPIDTNRMMVLEGGRGLAVKIIETVLKEPNMEKPVIQKRRPR